MVVVSDDAIYCVFGCHIGRWRNLLRCNGPPPFSSVIFGDRFFSRNFAVYVRALVLKKAESTHFNFVSGGWLMFCMIIVM